jgi:hypothetical protein
MRINKRGQAWSIDLVVGVIIFSVGVLIFFIYSVNQAGEAKESLEGLSYDGDILFSNILSEGYPQDWNENNVVKIGILDEDRINETKLERFYNFANNDYARTKSIFNTRYDYYFSFSNMTINSAAIEGIGKPGTDLNNINAINLLKITRFSIYKNKPITIYLYIWEG